jgi:hypothetical protein
MGGYPRASRFLSLSKRKKLGLDGALPLPYHTVAPGAHRHTQDFHVKEDREANNPDNNLYRQSERTNNIHTMKLMDTTKLLKGFTFNWRARREQERKAEEILQYLQGFQGEDNKVVFRKSENGGWICTIEYYDDEDMTTMGDWCAFTSDADDGTESTFEQSESSLYFMDGALQWSMDESSDNSLDESSIDVYYFEGALQLSIPTVDLEV